MSGWANVTQQNCKTKSKLFKLNNCYKIPQQTFSVTILHTNIEKCIKPYHFGQNSFWCLAVQWQMRTRLDSKKKKVKKMIAAKGVLVEIAGHFDIQPSKRFLAVPEWGSLFRSTFKTDFGLETKVKWPNAWKFVTKKDLIKSNCCPNFKQLYSTVCKL